MNIPSSLCQDNEWNVLHTFPNLERKVERHLNLFGIESILPLTSVVRQWKDRKKIVQIPLFPNYIFVNTNRDTRYKILNIKGVHGYVSFSGKRSVVSDKEIDVIRKIDNARNAEIETPLKTGDKVEVINGLFSGIIGHIFEKRGRNRLLIKLSSIDNFVSIEIASSDLRKLVERIQGF